MTTRTRIRVIPAVSDARKPEIPVPQEPQTPAKGQDEAPAVDLAQIEKLMSECSKAHKEQKKANAAYEKARKALYSAMLDAKLKQHVSQQLQLEAVVEHSKVTVIDKAKLEELVGHKQAQLVYSATKTAVLNKFGGEIAEACATTVDGTENVTVKHL